MYKFLLSFEKYIYLTLKFRNILNASKNLKVYRFQKSNFTEKYMNILATILKYFEGGRSSDLQGDSIFLRPCALNFS
jgi:hypothetical protein